MWREEYDGYLSVPETENTHEINGMATGICPQLLELSNYLMILYELDVHGEMRPGYGLGPASEKEGNLFS